MNAQAIISGALAITLAGTSVQAMTPVEGCSATFDAEVIELDAFDLGGGLTSFLTNDLTMGTILTVTNCFTGDFMRATVVSSEKTGSKEFPEALNVIEDATGEDVVPTYEQIAAALLEGDVPVEFSVDKFETCACAAAYPGLLGSKHEFGGEG